MYFWRDPLGGLGDQRGMAEKEDSTAALYKAFLGHVGRPNKSKKLLLANIIQIRKTSHVQHENITYGEWFLHNLLVRLWLWAIHLV